MQHLKVCARVRVLRIEREKGAAGRRPAAVGRAVEATVAALNDARMGLRAFGCSRERMQDGEVAAVRIERENRAAIILAAARRAIEAAIAALDQQAIGKGTFRGIVERVDDLVIASARRIHREDDARVCGDGAIDASVRALKHAVVSRTVSVGIHTEAVQHVRGVRIRIEAVNSPSAVCAATSSRPVHQAIRSPGQAELRITVEQLNGLERPTHRVACAVPTDRENHPTARIRIASVVGHAVQQPIAGFCERAIRLISKRRRGEGLYY